MRKQHQLTAYILIGLGTYFLIGQLQFAFFKDYYHWPTIVFIVGIAFLLHAYTAKEYKNIFVGVLLIGIGIHYHGLITYDFWYNHWSIYTLIVGIAFLIRFLKTKKGFVPAILLIAISIIMIFSISLPNRFQGLYGIIDFMETFWPVFIVLIGIFLLWKRK